MEYTDKKLEESEDRKLEEEKLDEWDAGVYPDEEKAKAAAKAEAEAKAAAKPAKAKGFSFEVAGYYKELRSALSEAAAYVMANGRRKKAELEDDTSTMNFHYKRFMLHMGRLDQLAAKCFVPSIDHESFFYNFVADTRLYRHKIAKGKNKGKIEERTISSARIDGYRKIIKKYEALNTAVSIREIEAEFQNTPIYAKLK